MIGTAMLITARVWRKYPHKYTNKHTHMIMRATHSWPAGETLDDAFIFQRVLRYGEKHATCVLMRLCVLSYSSVLMCCVFTHVPSQMETNRNTTCQLSRMQLRWAHCPRRRDRAIHNSALIVRKDRTTLNAHTCLSLQLISKLDVWDVYFEAC